MQQPWSFHNWAFMTVAQFGWPALWSRLSQLIWVLSQCLLMRGSLGKLSRHIFLKSNSFAVLFLKKCGMEKILFHTLFLLAQSRRKYKVYFSYTFQCKLLPVEGFPSSGHRTSMRASVIWSSSSAQAADNTNRFKVCPCGMHECTHTHSHTHQNPRRLLVSFRVHTHLLKRR